MKKDGVGSKELFGISGWLWLYTFSLSASLLYYLMLSLFYGFKVIFRIAIGEEKLLSLVPAVSIFVMLAFTIYTFLLELKQKREFRTFAIIHLWAGFIASVSMLVYYQSFFYTAWSFALSTMWTFYLVISRRVKNTFPS
jgi:hypothetical protein